MRAVSGRGNRLRSERAEDSRAPRGSGLTGWDGSRYFDNGVGGVIGTLGVPGTGKTFLLGHTLARCSRVIVCDTADAWGSGERLNPLPGQWLTLWSTDDLSDFLRDHFRGSFRVLFKFDGNSSHVLKSFLQICKLARVTRDVVIGVDEVWEFCDASEIPDDFARILLRGRTPGVTIVWAAQSPATISRRLTGVSTEMRIFRITEDTDLNSPALKAKVGRDVRALLPLLPDRHFVRIRIGHPWEICTSNGRGEIETLDLQSFKKSIGLP